ncbi:hypothetical protein D3C73_1337780 [compost metagenome]
MLKGNSLSRNIQNFRITFGKPGGRRGSRCAQNYLQSIAVGQIDSLVEQFELEDTFLRFEDGPGKFGQTDNCESGFNHPPVIVGPQLLRPVLGVVTYAKLKGFIYDRFAHYNLQRLICIIKNMLYSGNISIVLSSEMNNI